MIGAVFSFFLGALAMASAPAWVSAWVRGAAGWARDRVLGSARPAPVASVALSHGLAAPRETPRVGAGKALANIIGFFGGVLAWIARNPILAAGLVLLIAFLVFGRSCSPFDWGKSRGELRVERQAAEHEANVGRFANNRADETRRNVARARASASQGQQDIANAVASLPPDVTGEHFDNLDRIYRDAYLRVLNAPSDASPDPRRAPPVRGARANSA